MNQFNVNRSMMLTVVAGLSLIATTLLTSCSKSSEGNNVAPAQPASNPITGTTLSGNVKGTLLTGKTYTVSGDVTVAPKDTLFVQRGVTVNVTGNSTFYVQGTLISEGSQASPITFTASSAKPGSWGGFQCDSAKYVRIQWTHIDYTGGPDPSGSARISLIVSRPITVIVEDSWLKSGQDDGFRLQGGCMVSILRNTIESGGSTDGEAINIKTGATGTVAYNVIWSQAGSAIKLETSTTALFPQTNVKVYNNTLVSDGFRRGAAEPGRGILVDRFAQGAFYNNLIVNDYNGLDITTAADTKNITYGNNYFYATADSLRKFYYPAGSFGKQQTSDIVSTATTDKNPMFTKFDANYNSTTNNNDFHLQSGSPALGAGNTVYNKDIGAYTSDTQGNKH